MDKIIDAEYTVIDKPESGNKNRDANNIEINADPYSSAFKGASEIIKESIRCHTEYKICKAQEETKRAEIKARYKVAVEEIHAKYKLALDFINSKHEQQMFTLKFQHQILQQRIDIISQIIERESDFNNIKCLLQMQTEAVKQTQDFTGNMVAFNAELLLGGPLDGPKLLE